MKYLVILSFLWFASCSFIKPSNNQPENTDSSTYYGLTYREGEPFFTEDEIAANIHYPQITYNANKEGDVYLALLVDRNGEVTNTEILSSFDVYASASVTETLSKEIFYPKKVNKVPSVTLLYSKVSFELENAMVSVQFADTSFLPISTSQEEELLSRLIEKHIYITDPVLIGGLESLVVHYPEEALQEEVEGVVIVQFIVGERGDVIKPRVVQGLGFGCDEEAIKAVRRLSFKAGTKNGKPVPVNYTLPVYFILPAY